MPRAYGRDSVAPSEDGRWSIVSPVSKGWLARRRATRTTPEHPGTAIDWDGALWEVVAATATGVGARYLVAAWDDRHTIRVLERYDEASEGRREAERADDDRRRRKRRTLLVLSPLAGHLPAEVQNRWEEEDDAPASLLTLISALPLFVFGFLCTLSLAIRGFTGVAILPVPEGVLVLGIYLFVESGFRLSVAWSQGSPAGSLAGTIVWEVAERIRRARRR